MTWIVKGFNAIMFLLSSMIYLLINWLYQVFGAVANVNLFSEEIFEDLTGRIYLIMGIAMLFIFAYNLVLMIINPDDKKGTGAMSKVVKETIISLIAVVLLPTIFNYMYTFQSHVISSNILGQLILGGAGTGAQDESLCSEGDYECLCDFSFLGNNAQEVETACKEYRKLPTSERGARIVPVTIFSAFYRPANFSFDECAKHLATGDNSVIGASGDDHDTCVNYYTGYQKAKYSGFITYLGDQQGLRDGIYEDPKLMEFDSLFAVIAGALGAWMFLCYAMQIGVRVFKLGVLQLISPIPVMMRIVPGQKEKMYDKWFKELLNTYLDVFIRLIIIYFSLFAISLVPEMISTLFSSFSSGDSNIIIKLLAMVVIILGILDFAREAPELIKTFFGSSGRFSIKPKDQRGLNALRAGVYGATTADPDKNQSRLGGFLSGVGRGAFVGYDKAVKGIDTARTEKANNSTLRGRLLNRARVAVGMETLGEKDDRNINRIQADVDSNNEIIKSLDAIKDIANKAIEKADSKVVLKLSELDGDFKDLGEEFKAYSGSYNSLLATQDALKKNIESATTEADKQRAVEKYDRFTKAIEEMKKRKTNEGIDILINGDHDEKQFNFKDAELGSVSQELGKILGKGKIISDYESYDKVKKEVGEEIRNLSAEIASQYSPKYQARQADSRMVRGQGKSEKK